MPQRELARAFDRMARSYATDDRRTRVSSLTDAIAYACGRGFGTFAAVQRALGAVAQARPTWRPRTLLDLGAGTGSAAWAAVSTFDSIERVAVVEELPSMVEIGRRIFDAAPSVLRSATWISGDAARPPETERFDLVVASYVLGELPDVQRRAAVDRWLDAASEELVILEPGSKEGYGVVLSARDRLIELGASVTAPCPHDGTCPMRDGDWCHFGVRVQRSKLQRRVKAGERGFEDEKFAFVAASRHAVTTRSSRVVRRPQERGGHVRLSLCAADGLREEVVARRDGDAYRRARKAEWGDVFDG